MTTDGSSPMLSRWELSRALRELRTHRGLSLEQVTSEISEVFADSFSTAKLSRIENDVQAPLPRDVSELAHVYRVSPKDRERLLDLAKAAKKRSWTQTYATAESRYRTYADLESAASRIRNYESTFVPGFFQTPEYAEAVIRGLNRDYTAEHNTQLIDFRMTRQGRLAEPQPPQIHVIIQENSLLRTIGSKAIMADQIRRLQEFGEKPNITLQLIRFDAGVYQGLQASAFTLLDFPSPTVQPTVVYIEGILWNLFADDDSEKVRIASAFDEMAEQVALSPETTLEFLDGLHRQVTSNLSEQ